MNQSRRKTKKGRERAAAGTPASTSSKAKSADGDLSHSTGKLTSKKKSPSNSPLKSKVKIDNGEGKVSIPVPKPEKDDDEPKVPDETEGGSLMVAPGSPSQEIDRRIDEPAAGEDKLAEKVLGDVSETREDIDNPIIQEPKVSVTTNDQVVTNDEAKIVETVILVDSSDPVLELPITENLKPICSEDIPDDVSHGLWDTQGGIIQRSDEGAGFNESVDVLNLVPSSAEVLEESDRNLSPKMKLDPVEIKSMASASGEQDDLTPVNENEDRLPSSNGSPQSLKVSVHVQSDEEESSSADVWWTCREELHPESDDGSIRAISALSTLSIDELSDRFELPGSKRNSAVLSSPSSPVENPQTPIIKAEGTTPEKRDASTLTDISQAQFGNYQTGHESDRGSLESPTTEFKGRKAEAGAHRRGSLINRGLSLCEDSAEDSSIVDYLVDIQDGAEARLAARRQARAEAREIRMKELEKQQKESEENADKQYDMYSSDVVNRAAFRVALGNNHRQATHSQSLGSTSYHSSRRSSEESSEDGVVSMRDMRHELKELEDKFRKSMVQNAQLDNEKSALTYHVELLKDKIEDLEESLCQLQREHKDKSREFENLKRLSTQLKEELEFYKFQLHEKEELIKEYGLVVVENEVEVDVGNGERETRIKRTLVTQETASVLSTLGDGSLDVRLKRVLEEKNELVDELRRLKLDLEEERSLSSRGHYNNVSTNHLNGPEADSSDVHREVSKQMAEYKYKIQKYEQELLALQANVSRLDGQVIRFRTAAEEAETREDDLKVEKRKLQRELREAQSRLDELETTNSHLQKRLDKLKTAKSNLLKDL